MAESWITDLEMLFEELGCTDEQRVRYIGLKLTDEALLWWKSKKQLLTLELGEEAVITWNR